MLLKNYYQSLINNLNMSNFLRVFLYMLIFFQPFNRFNAFREIGFYGLLLLLLLKIFKDKAVSMDFKDKTIIAISLLVGWSLLVSILGPYPVDSLNAIRKNLLVQVLIFIVIVTEFKGIQELKRLLWVVVVSFFFVTFASIIEFANQVDWPKFHQFNKTHQMFIGGYANNATFYLPFIAAWLMALKKEEAWKKWVGTTTLLLGLAVVFIYNSRTALLAIPVGIFIILFLSKKYKLFIIVFIMFILSLSVIFLSKSDILSKYRTLSNPKTYVSNDGLSNRFGVWQGALYIIKERPLIGYGYGWKKMAWAAKDLNFAEYWKEKDSHVYTYYVDEAHLSYGKVNPHNLILQVVFEIGIIGLSILLWVWITVISKIYHAFRVKDRNEFQNFIVYSSGIIVSYALINITNGFWHETYGNMLFLFFATLFVLYRGFGKENKI